MWCTRWFLPLLLLPLPTATPYFLILFLVSLTFHARPCFYCIILLTALFTSSCYWQPVPTDVNVASIFPNWSMAEAVSHILNATTNVNGSQHIQPPLSDTLVLPKLTSLNDRCWCELSGARLFEPFNTTRWQLNSFVRTAGMLHTQTKPSNLEDVDNPESHAVIPIFEGENISSSNNKNWMAQFVTINVETLFSQGLFKMWRRNGFNILKPHNSATNTSIPVPDHSPKQPTSDFQASIVDLSSSLRAIRSVYDLRSHGIDLVLDFQWPRSTLLDTTWITQEISL